MNQKLARFLPKALNWGLLIGLTATLAFAQTSSFGQAAQGIATEMIAIAKWVGIILCIICGIGLMAEDLARSPRFPVYYSGSCSRCLPRRSSPGCRRSRKQP